MKQVHEKRKGNSELKIFILLVALAMLVYILNPKLLLLDPRLSHRTYR